MLDFKKVINMVQMAVKAAGPVNRLIEAGEPVMAALHKQAPELGAAIKDLVASVAPPDQAKPGTPALSHDHAAEVVAKEIFAPHQVDAHEKRWMDRASSTDFG